MTYKENDTVVYPSHGVCRILSIAPRTIGGQEIECYLINPIFDEKCHILIPTNNQKAMEKMQKPLTEQEIYALIDAIPQQKTIWIENSTQRKKRYEEILTSNDRRELVMLVKTLRHRRQVQNESGRKLHTSDEECLHTAEKMLHEEIAYVLGMNREDVSPFLEHRLAGKEAAEGTQPAEAAEAAGK